MFACLVGLILVSDQVCAQEGGAAGESVHLRPTAASHHSCSLPLQMWYWGHRSMHLPWAWKNLHKMHHIAPQVCGGGGRFL